jgi:hypothetical protein
MDHWGLLVKGMGNIKNLFSLLLASGYSICVYSIFSSS